MTYQSWNSEAPLVAPRSYLYRLQPIGVGTEYVESLTGYISRIAEAHSVAPSVLLRRELIPRLHQDSGGSIPKEPPAQNYGFIYDSYVLNGLSDCPRRWIGMLEAATGQNSLHVMTMLGWAGVISDLHLLRENRAWCPLCFHSRRREALPVYEPLIWAVKVVSVCPVHECVLQERCPRCERASPALTARSRPGFCGRCRSWLGVPALRDQSSRTSLGTQLRIARSVGGMAALAGSQPQTASATCFKENLRRCVSDFAGGNLSHFARLSGVSFDSIERWLVPGSSIRLDSFLRLCCRLQLPAARLLSEPIPTNDPEWECAWRLVHQISGRTTPGEPSCRRSSPQRVMNPDALSHTGDSLRKELERALAGTARRSLQSIANELGFNNSSSLYNRFPNLCRAIVLRNRRWREREDDRIREALTKAISEKPVPSMKEVAAQLGHTPTALRARFPELSAALAARVPERRRFDRDRLQRQLQTALELNPPAAMKHVARSVGREVNYLRSLFPELCRQITERHREEKRRISAQRKLRFCAEIRTAVTNLCERGVNPSRKRVFAAIVEPSMRCSHILDRQIADTLRELELASHSRS